MKRFLHNILYVLIFSILILLSYPLIKKHIVPHIPENIYQSVIGHLGFGRKRNYGENDSYHAVWLSYLEFESYLDSVDENNKDNFTAFYQHILDRCSQLNIDHIIVQVRPFGDAMYDSDYYPWSRYISGSQGRSPGYDPLEIMVELTHKQGMEIEAWINPFRVSSSDKIENLSDDNPAKVWKGDKTTTRNVLAYNGGLYYNPASKKVRELITDGVKEIVAHYEVDGIHMDDYFYPEFSGDDYQTAFDAQEYNSAIENGKISQDVTLPEWRRQNVNQLVSDIYKTVKNENSSVTFGISPVGDLENLRSDLAYYSDIDTWVSEKGYIDYIMPQIYWGYTNSYAPFDEILAEWDALLEDSHVTLYAGLQLYRLGESDDGSSDNKELQSADVIIKQLEDVKNDPEVLGYSLFSYQYLDVDDKEYGFESSRFSKKRKKILQDVSEYLQNK